MNGSLYRFSYLSFNTSSPFSNYRVLTCLWAVIMQSPLPLLFHYLYPQILPLPLLPPPLHIFAFPPLKFALKWQNLWNWCNLPGKAGPPSNKYCQVLLQNTNWFLNRHLYFLIILPPPSPRHQHLNSKCLSIHFKTFFFQKWPPQRQGF